MATKKVNIDIIAKDKSKRALNTVRGSLDKLKSSVFNVRNALAGLGAGLVIRNLVNTGKQLENLETRFKFLLKNAEEEASKAEIHSTPAEISASTSNSGEIPIGNKVATSTKNMNGLNRSFFLLYAISRSLRKVASTASARVDRAPLMTS